MIYLKYNMKNKTYFYISTLIFLIVGIVHLLKIVFGFKIWIGGFSFPIWLSWVEVVVAFYLAFVGFKLGIKSDSISK